MAESSRPQPSAGNRGIDGGGFFILAWLMTVIVQFCMPWQLMAVPQTRADERQDAPMPPGYWEVPAVYSLNPQQFADLLLGTHSVPTRIAHFGDSTALDNLGAGPEHMNWRRWLWHQYFGHTPGTQLSRSANFGGRVPGAEWIFMGSTVYPEPSIVPDSFLLPGHQDLAHAAKTFKAGEFGPIGLYLFLNHNNDNAQTMGCLAPLIGFYYVPNAIGAGIPAFAAGQMHGGASLIDADAGIRLEVLAVSHPASAPTVVWFSIPQTSGQFCFGNIFAPIAQSGAMFGGAQSLAGPFGAAFREQTPVLLPPSGLERFYAVAVSGASVNPLQAAQIIGARFVSLNPRGVIIDSLSTGGYSAGSVLQNQPNCGYALAAAGYQVAWLMYGINDQNLKHTSAEFKQDILNLMAFIRASVGIAGFPIVLETSTYKVGETDHAKRYAGALFEIAQSDANVLLINSRRVIEQRYGWGSGSEQSYLFDGTHYTNFGGQAIARCSIETVIARLTHTTFPLDFVRQSDAVHGKDTVLSSAAPLGDCGACTTLAVGCANAGSNIQRTLISFNELSAVPTGSHIHSASLIMTVASLAASPQPMEIDRVTNPNWAEGANDGSGASWLQSNGNPATPWSTPGGDFTSMGQVADLLLPAEPQAKPGNQVAFDITPLALDAFSNHGGVLALMLKRSQENAIDAVATFYSSDHTVASQRPMLLIKYTPPVAPGCVADCEPPPYGNGAVNIDDLLLIISNWGTAGGGGPADIAPPGGDGTVNIDDLLVVINGWGPCPITQ